MESKDPKSTESADAEQGAETKDPKSDATSSDTLSDVEEAEQVAEKEGEETEGSDLPSPDGAFDDGRGGEGGLEDAGPM